MLFKPPYTFLTTKPRKRLLSRNHPEWLAVLPIGTVKTPIFQAEIVYTDASTEVVRLNEPLINLVLTSAGTFSAGQTVTGQTSGATAEVVSWGYPLLVVKLTAGEFDNNETISNGSQTGVISSQTDQTPLRSGEVRALDVSFATRDWDAVTPAKTIRLIRIRILSYSFDEEVSTDYIEYVPYVPKGDLVRALYYHNSYGGIDSVICTGDQQLQVETTSYETRQPLDFGYELASQQIRMVDPYFRAVQNVHTGLKPALELMALQDLFVLKAAYEYREVSGVPSLIPIIPVGDSVSFPSEKDRVKNLSFSYRYAYEERAMDRQGI